MFPKEPCPQPRLLRSHGVRRKPHTTLSSGHDLRFCYTEALNEDRIHPRKANAQDRQVDEKLGMMVPNQPTKQNTLAGNNYCVRGFRADFTGEPQI